MDLLRRAARPIGRHVVRCPLDADPRLAVHHHHVPVVVDVERPVHDTDPEAALGGEIGGIEHDRLGLDLHPTIISGAGSSSR